jgi:hypothetical protein
MYDLISSWYLTSKRQTGLFAVRDNAMHDTHCKNSVPVLFSISLAEKVNRANHTGDGYRR